MATQISIVNGPSKLDLMKSCFDGKVVFFEVAPIQAGFDPGNKLAGVTSIRARGVSVEPEDGSFESWNIR